MSLPPQTDLTPLRRGPRSPFALPGVDRRVRLLSLGAIAASTVGLVCTIAWLLVLAATIDSGFLHDKGTGAVAPLLAAMLALVAIRAVTSWAAERLSAAASVQLRDNLRSALCAHLVAVGPAGLQANATGEVSSTIGAGVEALDDYTTKFLPAVVMAVIGPVLIFAVIAVMDPWTTPILLFTGPMLVLLLAVIGRRTADLTRRRFDELGWLSSFYLDMIGGLGTLKAFGRASDGARTIAAVSRRFNDTTMEVLRTAFQTSLVMEWAATAATALAAVAISFRMIETGMSFGAGLAVLVLVPEFFLPFRRLSLEYHAGQSGNAAMERIDALMTLPATSPAAEVTPELTSPLVDTAPSIHLRAVTYAYPTARGTARPALQDLDLEVGAGETVALVGPSGVGKTTVVRLVMGFITPEVGSVLINGEPLLSKDIRAWRRAISWVPQDPTLIAGTVAENIALGEPAATHEQIRAAAAVARAEAFIDDLPDGFDTVLGERGVRLSGGQRQRIAIARAALRDAPVVVLDEFTAHLDERTEADLLDAVAELLVDRTAVIVAHRARTIALAHRVVTLMEPSPPAGTVAS